jgi:hypothetical protein
MTTANIQRIIISIYLCILTMKARSTQEKLRNSKNAKKCFCALNTPSTPNECTTMTWLTPMKCFCCRRGSSAIFSWNTRTSDIRNVFDIRVPSPTLYKCYSPCNGQFWASSRGATTIFLFTTASRTALGHIQSMGAGVVPESLWLDNEDGHAL